MDPIWQVAIGSLVVGGLITWLVTHIYSARAKQKLVLNYSINERTLIRPFWPTLDKFKLMYGEKTVPNLVLVTIKFKNVGNITLSGDDFAENESLHIHTDQYLDCLETTVPSKANNIHLAIEGEKIGVNLEFLKPREKFEVRLVFEKSNPGISIHGVLKTGDIKEQKSPLYTYSWAIVLMVIGGAYLAFYPRTGDDPFWIRAFRPIGVFLLLYGIPGLFALIASRFAPKRTKITSD